MLKLSIHLAIWILVSLLLDAVVTENKNHSNLQEVEISANNFSQNFWESGLLRKDDSNRSLSSTEILQLGGDHRIEYNNKRAMKSESAKTLLDYNGPAITEDIRSDRVVASHIRVKRSESTNEDSLPYFWSKNNTICAFGEPLSTFKGPCADYSSNKLESDTTTRTYSRRNLQSDTSVKRLKRFKNIGKNIESIEHEKRMYRTRAGNRAVRSIEEIKDLVEKLVVKVNELQMYVSNYSETSHTTDFRVSKKDRTARLSEKSNCRAEFVRNTDNHERLTNDRQPISTERIFQMPPNVSRVTRANSRSRRKLLRKWNRWTDWSSCSVTCGKGRQIRWRHCLRDCDDAEIEMEEKACQLPACPPGKFLGIF